MSSADSAGGSLADASTGAYTTELEHLLETAAYVACTRFGASHLILEGAPDKQTRISLVFADETSVDLWELDPLLWDDANWAAARAVAAGTTKVVLPVLHRQ